jgi:hypothetical protein
VHCLQGINDSNPKKRAQTLSSENSNRAMPWKRKILGRHERSINHSFTLFVVCCCDRHSCVVRQLFMGEELLRVRLATVWVECRRGSTDKPRKASAGIRRISGLETRNPLIRLAGRITLDQQVISRSQIRALVRPPKLHHNATFMPPARPGAIAHSWVRAGFVFPANGTVESRALERIPCGQLSGSERRR